MTVRFNEEQMRAFTRASMDTSPLHTSDDYARKTPFGERLVYGSLAVAACLAHVTLPAGKSPATVRADYKGPMVLDVDYALQVSQDRSGEVRAVLSDGSVPVLRLRLQVREGAPRVAELVETGTAPRTESRPTSEGLWAGLHFQGAYGPGRKEYLHLLELLGLDRRMWGDGLLVAVLCGSYVSGMEIPGDAGASAAFQAEILDSCVEQPSAFAVTLAGYDARFGRVESGFTLSQYARGSVVAVVRPPLSQVTAPAIPENLARYAGKTALVIGASRGLGAALALGLAAEGCAVMGTYFRSRDEAAAVADIGRGLTGRLLMEQGDAADPNWCAAVRERIKADFGKLDLLVLSAAPAILPLRVEEAHFARIQAYLQKGFAVAGVPLAHLLEMVSASKGAVLFISAATVEQPPALWPHYVALKSALEGMMHAAAAEHPAVRFWIARPGKMETDLVNTPLGRLDAEQPGTVARRILECLARDASSGAVHFCA